MNQPLAYVHPGAKIAKNVVVEPFTTISNNVEIGEGTWVGSNVTIMEGARIGRNCFIYPGSVISGTPQDLKFEGEDSICEIGDNTTIRECVTINRGTKERDTTIIGKNWSDVFPILEKNNVKSFETDTVEGMMSYFNEANWLFVHVDYNEIVKIEVGAVFSDKDEFDWKF